MKNYLSFMLLWSEQITISNFFTFSFIKYRNKNEVIIEQKARGWRISMDYELMMNGNVKIGQRAPEFEANTTMRQNIFK